MLLKNLLTISWRSMSKDRSFTLINIGGLTIGITCSLYLFLFIIDELSYDRYHANADSIYRIVTHVKEGDDEYTRPMVQIPLTSELSQYQGVKSTVRFFTSGRELFRAGAEKLFYEEGFYFTDSTIFDVFSYEFISGDPATALDDPFTIVLTRSMALKYFDTPDAVGKVLSFVDRNEEYKVTGVIRDVPHNSHFHFDALMNVGSLPMFRQQTNWGRLLVSAYIQFEDNFDATTFQPALDSAIARHVRPIFEKRGIEASYHLQRITDIHLYSDIQDEEESGGDVDFLYALGAVAVFMIIIACINYMNLATARSSRRAREVGIRKVIGSSRSQLMFQFTIEALLFGIAAVGLSIILLVLLQQPFNELTGKALALGDVFDKRIMYGAGAILIVVTIAGGLYPAFYLSSFVPATVLKSNAGSHDRNSLLRRLLVIAQFGISIFMLIATIITYDELRFLESKELGFNKMNLLRIAVDDGKMRGSLSVFKNKVATSKYVSGFATASDTPGQNVKKAVVFVEDNEGKLAERGIDYFVADYDFCDVMEMKIGEGRNFSRDFPADTATAILVNEAMVRKMGWDEPIGKQFQPEGKMVRRVIGVINDFHQNSLYNTIEPLVVLLQKNNYYTYIRIEAEKEPAAIADVEQAWKQVYPGKPFEYMFMDDAFDAQYDVDRKRTTLLATAAGLTIVIACLGLLGLTSFVTEQREREIGIRKVVGSSVGGIVMLISKEFMILLVIATLVAIPCGYIFMDKWLSAFPYRLTMAEEVPAFLFASLGAITIGIGTVAWHSTKAALTNPVDVLKSE